MNHRGQICEVLIDTGISRRGKMDRGRESGLNAPPPSEPDVQISRIRLSGQWVLKRKTVTVNSWAFAKLNNPCLANQRLVQR